MASNQAFEDDAKVLPPDTGSLKHSSVAPQADAKSLSSSSSSSEGSKKDAKKKGPEPVGFISLYRYATGTEKIMLLVALCIAVLHGALLPLLFVSWGDMIDGYTTDAQYMPCNFTCQICVTQELWDSNCDCTAESCTFYDQFLPDSFFASDSSQCLYDPTYAAQNKDKCAAAIENSIEQEALDQQIAICNRYAVFGAIALVIAIMHAGIFTKVAANMVSRIEKKFFRSLLSQEMAFFDENPASEFNNRLSDDIYYIKSGSGDKVTQTAQFLGQAVAGLAVGFTHSWALSLVVIACSPVVLSGFAIMAVFVKKSQELKSTAYAAAGSVAEEVIGNIRTVQSFGGQAVEGTRYIQKCEESNKAERNMGYYIAGSMGMMFFSIFGMYAVSFAFGTFLYTTPNESLNLTSGDILSSFFGVFIGLFSLALSSSNLQFFGEAQAAAARIYQIIERKSKIDPLDTKSLPDRKPTKGAGMRIQFKNVEFSYPTRKEMMILKGLNLSIESGKTIALVGASGGGKSTVIGLVQRLYDVDNGSIHVDGEDVREVNVKSLRQDIGVVSQEPVLFACSILENIRNGMDLPEDKVMEEVTKAAKLANAHEFIKGLPEGYNTYVGPKGAQLSGGQKQRIAIARAIIRKPKLLLLDEATSALDANSEKLVQAALNKVSELCTTIIIAHRLSTVRSADRIYALRDGQLVEEGTHEELIQLEDGLYAALVKAQAEAGWEDKKTSVKKKRLESENEVAPPAYDDIQKQKSVLQEVKKTEDEEVEHGPGQEQFEEVSFMTVLKMNSPEWMTISFGILGCMLAGLNAPLNAIFFTSYLEVYNTPATPDKVDYIWSQALPWVYCYIGLAVLMGVSNFLKWLCFTWSGLALTKRLRGKYFNQTVNQDIEYFDDPNHTPGALCSRLATDTTKVSGVTGIRLGMIAQSFFTMIACLAIGFYYSWQLTLMLIVIAPLMMVGAFLETRYQIALRSASGKDKQKNLEDKTDKDRQLDMFREIAYETMANIRTVAMLSLEDERLKEYEKSNDFNHKGDNTMAAIRGLSYGFSSSMIFFAMAATFRLGVYLIIDAGLITYTEMQRVLMSLVFGANEVGQSSSMAPDYAEAKIAANRIFALLDRVPKISSQSNAGRRELNTTNIESENVEFYYPTRAEIQVLKKINFQVDQFKTVAFVGQSGCGKSTVFQLLQRFYDYSHGALCVDGTAIRENHLKSLRKQYGIVQQEPVLFSRTVEDNIRYGLIEDMKVPEEADVEGRLTYNEHKEFAKHVPFKLVKEAAIQANADQFIEAMPEGYKTVVGEGQLSGGQKQRVAIARALIRSPRVLLLDEATSALDTESEQQVSAALEKAQDDRTCLLIAHRLATVRKADLILVIDNGQVVEQGNHRELIDKRGVYYNLVQAQL